MNTLDDCGFYSFINSRSQKSLQASSITIPAHPSRACLNLYINLSRPDPNTHRRTQPRTCAHANMNAFFSLLPFHGLASLVFSFIVHLALKLKWGCRGCQEVTPLERTPRGDHPPDPITLIRPPPHGALIAQSPFNPNTGESNEPTVVRAWLE